MSWHRFVSARVGGVHRGSVGGSARSTRVHERESALADRARHPSADADDARRGCASVREQCMNGGACVSDIP